MKKMNSLLDERQETDLLKIERNGCWLAFWSLLASIFVQLYFLENSFDQVAAEWIIFMVLALYLAIDCMRKGIWSRTYRPDPRVNLAFSAVGTAFSMAFAFFTIYRRTGGSMRIAAGAGLLGFIFTFILIFVTLSLSAAAYKKGLSSWTGSLRTRKRISETAPVGDRPARMRIFLKLSFFFNPGPVG